MNALVRNWWAMLLRGIVAVLFGACVFLWPSFTLGVLVVVFGGYAILDGAFAIVAGVRASPRPIDAWPVVLEGLVSLSLGILAFAWPYVSHRILHVIAGWGVLTGVLEIIAAVRLPREGAGHLFLSMGGVSSIFLAGLLFALPHAAQGPIMWIIGVYAVVFGCLLSAAGLRLRISGALRARPAR